MNNLPSGTKCEKMVKIKSKPQKYWIFLAAGLIELPS